MNRDSVDRVAQLSKKGAKIGTDVVIHESAEIAGSHIKIGDLVRIGANTRIFANNLVINADVQIGSNCTIRCNKVLLGEGTRIGNNNDIQPYALFKIGETSHIGNQTHIRGREVTIGDEAFITNGFRVGGGGRNDPEAILTIGDRCTMHNNFINLAKPVRVGNDVGFSPEAIFITHGYWQSVLEGYSATYAPITIHDWVIIGMRAIILPGVEIGEGTTVGAGSVVSRSLPARCVAAGVPARVIKSDYPSPISEQKQDEIMKEILQVYVQLLVDKGFEVKSVKEEKSSVLIEALKNAERTILSYFRGPKVPEQAFEGNTNILLTFSADIDKPDTVIMNLRTLKIIGQMSPLVHDLRDFLRRYGIRFYGYGFFQSLRPQIGIDLGYDKLY